MQQLVSKGVQDLGLGLEGLGVKLDVRTVVGRVDRTLTLSALATQTAVVDLEPPVLDLELPDHLLEVGVDDGFALALVQRSKSYSKCSSRRRR